MLSYAGYKSLRKAQGIVLTEGANLRNLTTFRIGGKAKYFVEVYTREGLKELFNILKSEEISLFVIGRGSNLLIRDGEIEEILFLRLGGEFKSISLSASGNSARVLVGCGYSLPALSRFAFENSLEGIEFCIGIPGSIGGGIVMNAGAHGREIKDIVKKVFCLTREGEGIVLPSEEINFSYRSSNLKDLIVIFVELELKVGSRDEIKRRMDENLKYRKVSQPKGFSAGSVFKNPEGFKAWKLIREVGLSGYRIGDVMFSEKHANFIINLGNGKADDVISLIRLARQRVYEKFGITLEPEITLVGLSL